MAGGHVNRATLESFYQQPGDVYDDTKTEGAFETVAQQVDVNWDDFATHKDAAVLGHPDGSVTTAKIKDGAVTAVKVADASLTAAKFVPGALSNDTQNALRISQLESDRVKKAGDTMTGKLTVPEFEVANGEITKINVASFSGTANEKIDIEIPPGFSGTFEVTVSSAYTSSNASGSIRKVITFSTTAVGAILLNESYYSLAASAAANCFAISDVIWDSDKGKHVIKVVKRVSTLIAGFIVVKIYAGQTSAFISARNVAFSPVYTADTTAYPIPVDVRSYILIGAGSPEGAVTATVGKLYLRTDGGTTTTLYVKTSGTGNTGWTAK